MDPNFEIFIILILLITYLKLIDESRNINRLEKTGNQVIMCIMRPITMVITVGFFFSGLKPIILSLINV